MSLILVSMSNIWVMIATIAMSLIFYGLRHIYVSTGRCLRRMDAIGDLKYLCLYTGIPVVYLK